MIEPLSSVRNDQPTARRARSALNRHHSPGPRIIHSHRRPTPTAHPKTPTATRQTRKTTVHAPASNKRALIPQLLPQLAPPGWTPLSSPPPVQKHTPRDVVHFP